MSILGSLHQILPLLPLPLHLILFLDLGFLNFAIYIRSSLFLFYTCSLLIVDIIKAFDGTKDITLYLLEVTFRQLIATERLPAAALIIGLVLILCPLIVFL